MEHLQPYIGTILEALIGLLVAFVLGVVAMLRVKITTWLESRTTAQQLEILHCLAQEGMSLAESQLYEWDGKDKLNSALDYVLKHTRKYGISIDKESIIAAVEKAVLDYNAKVKGDKNDRS